MPFHEGFKPEKCLKIVQNTISLLRETLGEQIISCNKTVNWPPQSCDLSPTDYFLKESIKSLIHADEPHTLDHLEINTADIHT